jgi:hypothetical protein
MEDYAQWRNINVKGMSKLGENLKMAKGISINLLSK